MSDDTGHRQPKGRSRSKYKRAQHKYRPRAGRPPRFVPTDREMPESEGKPTLGSIWPTKSEVRDWMTRGERHQKNLAELRRRDLAKARRAAMDPDRA